MFYDRTKGEKENERDQSQKNNEKNKHRRKRNYINSISYNNHILL